MPLAPNLLHPAHSWPKELAALLSETPVPTADVIADLGLANERELRTVADRLALLGVRVAFGNPGDGAGRTVALAPGMGTAARRMAAEYLAAVGE